MGDVTARPARPKTRHWSVYLLRCADGTLYCGITNDLQKRIAAHNGGRGARYTRSRGPVALAWTRRCRSKSAALKLECRLKQLKKAQKESLATLPQKKREKSVAPPLQLDRLDENSPLAP